MTYPFVKPLRDPCDRSRSHISTTDPRDRSLDRSRRPAVQRCLVRTPNPTNKVVYLTFSRQHHRLFNVTFKQVILDKLLGATLGEYMRLIYDDDGVRSTHLPLCLTECFATTASLFTRQRQRDIHTHLIG